MKKILLTSAGFENPRVQECFLELLGKPAGEARALFIPTAAIDDEARAVLPKCRGDLLGAGIPPERIKAVGFDLALDAALERGLVYVGVSAGSIISARNLPGNLGYLPRKLDVHCESGSAGGKLPEGTVYLTNAQAIRILGGDAEIIG